MRIYSLLTQRLFLIKMCLSRFVTKYFTGMWYQILWYHNVDIAFYNENSKKIAMISIQILFHLDFSSQNWLSDIFLLQIWSAMFQRIIWGKWFYSTLYGLYHLEYITNHSRYKLLKSCFNHIYNPIIVCLENNIMCNIL